MFEYIVELCARRRQFGRKFVHLGIAIIANCQCFARIKHTEAVDHIVQGEIKPYVCLFELHFVLKQFSRIVFKDLNGASHITYLIAIIARRDLLYRYFVCKTTHEGSDAIEAPKDPAGNCQSEWPNKYKCGDSAY